MLFLLFTLLFSGCSLFGERNYVVVEPHNEGYEEAVDSDAISVSSYLGLKNAILEFVENGVTDGVIIAESYSGNITEDLDDAVYEVWRSVPIGAYAVDYMTYDCARIVNQYEIHIHTTYRRTLQEIRNIDYAGDNDAVQLKLREAMSNYADTLTLRVADFEHLNIQQLVEKVYRSNPSFALEIPATSVTSYPETGNQRIVEIRFLYDSDPIRLQSYILEVNDLLDDILKIYSVDNDERICARRFYNRVCRDGMLVTEQDDLPYADSVYGALILGRATSYGYAQTYILLLDSEEIPCELVEGTFMGQRHYWVRLMIDNSIYYSDPSMVLLGAEADDFLLKEEDLGFYGYDLK